MRGRTILLVEDDAHDEELIRMALGNFRLRNELVVVRDSEAAVDSRRSNGCARIRT